MDKGAALDAADQKANTSQIRTGKIVVNLDTRVVLVDDQPVHFTRKEYGILEFAEHAQRDGPDEGDVLQSPLWGNRQARTQDH
jgi:DNA-binding response OmpR family regulator